MPKLLRDNLDTLRKGLEIQSLPPVFAEAIAFCSKLSINDLWIDALCLIQDSELDCKSEIERMGDIYSHAFCNFSATAAIGLPLGLFVDSGIPHHVAFRTTVQRKDMHVNCYGYSGQALTELNEEPLMRRGWVLQERLLSPRSIYFGRQLSWECAELLANQLFPAGTPSKNRHISWGHNTPFKLKTMLCHDTELAGELIRVGPETEKRNRILYQRWLQVVDMYAACNLSFEDDVFPAISGLARRFNEALDDVYLAGLWQGDLVRGLMWQTHQDSKPNFSEDRAYAYRAPSWSWASVHAKTTIRYLGLGMAPRQTILITIIDARTTLAGTDSMGQVTNGSILLSGQVRKRTRVFLGWVDPVLGANTIIGYRYDDPSYRDQDVPGTTPYLLPVEWVPASEHNIRQKPGTPKEYCPAMITGLLLKAVSTAEKDTYERIGTFTHPWGEYCSDEQRQAFPGFHDLDPDHVKRQKITLV
ncbi:hypothetical protein BDW02DRAFT_600061 [Decorospora gaudefroyi]|uniref:Heterokaryon incompatibility domain-containing protein n=1 Tax=Decorospora gaudefroyi TaxID=184978 RepID=A0A6A5KBR4_9PLEO|nr:hypothetical protein BDW02DRAFT_600061 [Decorospora gaudefroyi]